jgi:hypothetical protein
VQVGPAKPGAVGRTLSVTRSVDSDPPW